MLVLCWYLQQILPSKQRLFWGSNNANELYLDPGPSEGFVVSRCTCERVELTSKLFSPVKKYQHDVNMTSQSIYHSCLLSAAV